MPTLFLCSAGLNLFGLLAKTSAPGMHTSKEFSAVPILPLRFYQRRKNIPNAGKIDTVLSWIVVKGQNKIELCYSIRLLFYYWIKTKKGCQSQMQWKILHECKDSIQFTIETSHKETLTEHIQEQKTYVQLSSRSTKRQVSKLIPQATSSF